MANYKVIDNMKDLRKAIKECKQIVVYVRMFKDDYIQLSISKAELKRSIVGLTSLNIILTNCLVTEDKILRIG